MCTNQNIPAGTCSTIKLRTALIICENSTLNHSAQHLNRSMYLHKNKYTYEKSHVMKIHVYMFQQNKNQGVEI